MNNKSIVLITVLFGLIVFGMFQYAILRSAEQSAPVTEPDPLGDIPVASDTEPTSQPPPRDAEDTTPPLPVDSTPPQVTAQRQFANGLHSVSGTITLPNPCYTVESDVMILESYPEQVQIRLIPVETDEMCAQVVTDIPYEVQFSASEAATVTILYADDSEPALTL